MKEEREEVGKKRRQRASLLANRGQIYPNIRRGTKTELK